jgi:glycosyltransferase involved in cell wall biosynthesis
MNDRLLMVAPTMFSADYGGSTRIIEHVKAFKRIGCSIRLQTYSLKGNLDKEQSIKVDTLPYVPRFYQGAMLDRGYLDLAMTLKMILSRNVKPDFILSYNQEATIAAKVANLHKVPLVTDVQGILREEMSSLNKFRGVGRLVSIFEKKLFEFPSLILTSSPFIAKYLNREVGVNSKKLKVLLDTADTEIFMPRPKNDLRVRNFRSALGISEDVRVVSYVGTFSPLQGTDMLLKATKYVLEREKNVFFLLAGGRWSSYYNSYIQLAKNLGVSSKIKFLPGVDYIHDLPYLLNMSEVAIAPKRFSLQSHGKLAALMASGLPTVVWDNPLNRIFLDNLGIYAKDISVEALGEAIILSLGKAKDESFKLKLRARAERDFSLNRLVNDMLGIRKMLVA